MCIETEKILVPSWEKYLVPLITRYSPVLREGSLFINGGIRAESRGARKNAMRFEGGEKNFDDF